MRWPDQTCPLEETCELLAKVGSMPRVEINLVGAAIDAELHRLIGWAASQVVLQPYIDPLHYAPRCEVSAARPGLRLHVIPTFRTI
jgi:hypothetical protein